MTTRLDLSIGPVQGFVAQSRRTRDLWGEFLAPVLPGRARHARLGEGTGGGIVQPVAENNFLFQFLIGR